MGHGGRGRDSLLASASEKKVRNSWYSSGMSMGASLSGGSSIALMSATLIAKVDACSRRRFSFLAILLNAGSETAAMLMGRAGRVAAGGAGCVAAGGDASCAAAAGHAGGGSSALTLIIARVHAAAQRAESNPIVPAAQRMVGS